jgi:hypothetical protein
MSRHRLADRVNVVMAVRALWGMCLLLTPRRVAVLLGAPSARRDRTVIRVLGARHVLQSIWQCTAAYREDLGSAVDGAHALSALAVASGSPRWRRAASIDAVIASTLAAATWLSTSEASFRILRKRR